MAVKNICYGSTDTLLTNITSIMKDHIEDAIDVGWSIYAVDAVRGRCCYSDKTLTIPLFALKRGLNYKLWYISHEVAHIYSMGDHHGPIFMKQLKIICPPEAIIHEIGYKPLNAVKAGILCTDF